MSDKNKYVRLSPASHLALTRAKLALFGRETSRFTYSEAIEKMSEWVVEVEENE